MLPGISKYDVVRGKVCVPRAGHKVSKVVIVFGAWEEPRSSPRTDPKWI
jgi:hypothetical protein